MRPPDPAAPNLDWALWYTLTLGWPVFPCHTMREREGVLVCSCGGGGCKPGKHPLTPNGFEDATVEEAQIREWWTRVPDANIATPYPSVLDCDLPRDSDPADGVAEYRKLEKRHGVVAGVAVARSGGDGLHVYFAPGAEAGKVGPGLSMRGKGNYAVLPPSLHESGRRYMWERPPLADRPLPVLPDWLAKRQTAATKKLKAKVFDTAERIPVNERHDAIGAYIGGLRRRNPGLSEDEALELAHAFRLKRCEHPEEKVDDVDSLVAYVYAKEPPVGDMPFEGPVVLAELLADTRAFFTRYIVVEPAAADAVALWVAHTHVFDSARATPYLHFHSPEPGSGKTAALEVLAFVCRAAVSADDLTAAAMYRLIEKRKPTLLFDEVDGVFNKKQNDSTEDIRKVLNSGYKAGKVVYRCVPPSNELGEFHVFCPKALAGLNELPGTLAHRAVPVGMQPPLPDEPYAELDDDDEDEFRAETALLRSRFEAWAVAAEPALRNPRLKPAKLAGLDARGNEIWRILFRIADLAGEDWPARARAAAVALSGGSRHAEDRSQGLKLLADVRRVFVEERMTCKALMEALNALDGDEGEWGGWNDGKGINTRQVGHRLKPFKVIARKLRKGVDANKNGYHRDQFRAVWARYLPDSGFETGTTGTTLYSSQKPAETKPAQNENVPVSTNGANPHEHRDVPVVPVLNPEYGLSDVERALAFDGLYPKGTT